MKSKVLTVLVALLISLVLMALGPGPLAIAGAIIFVLSLARLIVLGGRAVGGSR